MGLADGTPSQRVLIITGAGASTALGAGGRPLPLMPAWATSLVGSLGHRAQQIGLEADMLGDKFEEKLGQFLAFQAALPAVQPYAHITSGPGNAMGIEMSVGNWFHQASVAADEIRRLIWTNLFDDFGRDRVDGDAATESYRALHSLIRAADQGGPEAYLAHATTNYDSAIEIAVRRDKQLTIVDGFVADSGGGRETYAANLLADQWQTTNQVPVLHIHGAVGWYFQADGSITRAPTNDRFDERRLPALLLPDDTKNPDVFDTPIRQTWESLRGLLRAATHVLFIGHSLHDAHIVEALKRGSQSVAVMTLSVPDDAGKYAPPAEDAKQWIDSVLPGATLIAGKFGQRAGWPDLDERALERWLLTAPARHAAG